VEKISAAFPSAVTVQVAVTTSLCCGGDGEQAAATSGTTS